MKKISYSVLIALVLLSVATVANAQATRTWVSGVGDDVNPCSRTAPCKTWAGAISKTAAHGEINALDPGGFGTLTITKSITVDGAGTHASALNALTNGFIINDAATGAPGTIEVTLRNVSVNGANTGLDGVRFLSGKRLTLDNVYIFNGTGDGIEVSTTTAGAMLQLRNVAIENMGTGMNIHPTGGSFSLSIIDTTVNRMRTSHGIHLNGTMSATLRNVNTHGAGGASGSGVFIQGTADVSLDHVVSSNNVFGIQTSGAGPNVRMKDCLIVGNSSVGVQNNGGVITTFQSNVINGTGGVISSAAPQ